MDRNREARRASIVGSNGFNRRRHRTNSLRDSPDEDGGLELQESVRLRDRVKKDRDRDRERERERERDIRERSSRSKIRRAERLMSNRDDIGGDGTSEESVSDDEDDEDEENTAGGGAAAVRLLTPAVGSISNHHQNHHVHVSNHHHIHSSSFSHQQQHNNNSTSNVVSSNNHHLQHRKTFPPSSSSAAKVFRAPPVWKSGDEMISVSVPRKARSASKRSHDWISSSSNNNSGGDQNPAQTSSSPARQSHVSTSTAPPPPPPMSPSSFNVSIRKKHKHSVNNTTGPKLKPPKVSSSKPSSSNPEDLEIEIAEVLYGLMTQSQGPSSSSKKEDPREVYRLNNDAKSLNSSPISNSTSNNNPILGPNSSPLSAVAPKRKRPRQVPDNSSYGGRSSPISAKPDTDQTPKSEITSPNLEKISGFAAENGCEMGGNSVNSQGHQPEPPVPTAPESIRSNSELKPVAEELRESRDFVVKEDVSSSKEQESPVVRALDNNNRDSPSIATASPAATLINTNLMVSEIEYQKEEKFEIDLMAPPPQVRSSPQRETKIDLRASAVVDQKPVLSILDADLKPVVVSKDNEEKKHEEAESNKAIDLEKPDRDVSSSNENKLTQKQQQPQIPLKAIKEEEAIEKPGHSTSSLPLPMSMASWPGGLPPMGYMTPLQGVVSMDGGSVTPAHIQQPLFSQPRPKRCATHCHIARNIHCLQQFMKMNPFWAAPAGSPASLFGSKPCNLNVVPPADINVAVRGVVNNAQDKGQSVASISNNGGKDRGYQPASSSDSTQRKQQQILIQQALPPVAPSNLLGPTFIFPLNHQQQAAMAGRPKTPTTAPSSNTSPTPAAPTSSPAPTPMSFNYPNMSPNETQYLAILQNNAYPFPIPTVGTPPPNYRGGPAQAMPLFNGSFYPSQIIHHQQLQHSQQPQQLMQAHQNATTSNNSSSSQKHIQSQQQQRPPQSSGNASLQNNFSSQKAQSHNQYMLHGSEDSPSTNDNRGSRASMNIYGQNFALPIHPQNFALMTPPPPPAALATGNSNQNEKRSHQTQQQQQGLKTGVDSLPPHTFAMSFGPFNGTPAGPAGIDASSMAQNHATFQSCPEAARQNIQMMAVADQVAQKNFRISEDNGKSGNVDSSSKEDERKSFSSIQGNNVIESSPRSLTVGSGPARTSRPVSTNSMMGAMNVVPNAHVQAQLQQQQMLQLKQQQQQQQMTANAVNRTKVPVTSNGSIYSEHLNSSSTAGPKFPNAISPFPQNHLVHSNNTSPSQSPQWKSSTRTPGSQGPPSVSMHKNIPQQHSRTQHQHAQISFGGNQKQQTATSQGQQAPPSSSNQVGSPTTSSVSKGTSGSPRTASSASTNNKTGHAASFSAQPPKNSPSMPTQKSPSILGNPHGAKTQMQQQSQPKTMHQQAQLFFSNPYSLSQSQAPHSMSTTSSATAGPSGYYMPQRRPDQHQRTPGAPSVSLSNTSTNDPATAIAAATCNVKGGGFQSQGVIHGSPFGVQSMGMMLPAGFSYVHPVQVKPAEQKQPAGNDSLHPWQPEKK